MKKFKIPCTWEVYGTVEVEAETLEDAVQKAIEIEDKGEGFPLPLENHYVDASFRIDTDVDIIAAENYVKE